MSRRILPRGWRSGTARSEDEGAGAGAAPAPAPPPFQAETTLAPPTQVQLSAMQQAQTTAGAIIPPQEIRSAPAIRTNGWMAWLSNPSVAYTAVQAFLTRDTQVDLGQIAALRTTYTAAPGVESRLIDPLLGPDALKVLEAGQQAHAQSSEILKSFMMYRTAYKADGSSKSDPRTLLTLTNRVLEDVLLYLVLNSKKNKLKTALQLKASGEPLGNSYNVTLSVWSKPVDLLPPQLLDGLNEVIRANPEKAKAYFLEAGIGARESARIPSVIGTNAAKDEAEYDTAMEPAIKLTETILNKRAEAYGKGERGVFGPALKSRMIGFAGPVPAAPAAQGEKRRNRNGNNQGEEGEGEGAKALRISYNGTNQAGGRNNSKRKSKLRRKTQTRRLNKKGKGKGKGKGKSKR